MSDHQQMQKGRRYIQAIKTQEEYDALLQFATSTFRVPVKQRTTQQNNARIRFYRNKEHFLAHENKLFYGGKGSCSSEKPVKHCKQTISSE